MNFDPDAAAARNSGIDDCRTADAMTSRQIHERLRKRALRYPEATEDHPWGETAIKVNGKGFVFMGMREGESEHVGEAPILA